MTEPTQTPPERGCDLQITLNAALGQKLLTAVEFPFAMAFGEGSFSEADVESFLADASEELDAVIQDVVVQPLADSLQREQKLAGQSPCEAKADAMAVEEETATTLDNDSDPAAVKRTRVQLLALALEVAEPPSMHLGQPVILSNITVRVQAQVRACVRVFGRWRCMDTTTPWMTLSGCAATVNLSADGSAVLATPVVQNMDMQLSLKLFKWPVSYRLNLTRIVNRELKKRGPVPVLDLSSLQQNLVLGGKRACIHSITFAEAPTGLLISGNLAVD